MFAIVFAVTELRLILSDAWQAADVVDRLRAWWWTVTHQELLEDGIASA